jgi:predicted transcriptional regulator
MIFALNSSATFKMLKSANGAAMNTIITVCNLCTEMARPCLECKSANGAAINTIKYNEQFLHINGSAMFRMQSLQMARP